MTWKELLNKYGTPQSESTFDVEINCGYLHFTCSGCVHVICQGKGYVTSSILSYDRTPEQMELIIKLLLGDKK